MERLHPHEYRDMIFVGEMIPAYFDVHCDVKRGEIYTVYLTYQTEDSFQVRVERPSSSLSNCTVHSLINYYSWEDFFSEWVDARTFCLECEQVVPVEFVWWREQERLGERHMFRCARCKTQLFEDRAVMY